MGGRREDHDEGYIIDLCDEVLGRTAVRQQTFEFLRGDVSPTTGRSVPLPCDSYYADLNLVVEFHEHQHFVEASVLQWDNKKTISTINGQPANRKMQRAYYEQIRRDELPKHNISYVELLVTDFEHKGKRRKTLVRDKTADLAVIKAKLAKWVLR